MFCATQEQFSCTSIILWKPIQKSTRRPWSSDQAPSTRGSVGDIHPMQWSFRPSRWTWFGTSTWQNAIVAQKCLHQVEVHFLVYSETMGIIFTHHLVKIPKAWCGIGKYLACQSRHISSIHQPWKPRKLPKQHVSSYGSVFHPLWTLVWHSPLLTTACPERTTPLQDFPDLWWCLHLNREKNNISIYSFHGL